MEWQREVFTEKTVAETIHSLEESLAARGFAVLWHLHVNQKLAEKGFSLAPDVHILEVCSAPRAQAAIETNLAVTGLLPCKITVASQPGATRVAFPRPTMLMQVLDDARLQPLAEEVEGVLAAAVSAAC